VTWHYAYRTSDGVLIAESSEAIAPEAVAVRGLAVLESADRIDLSTSMWDEATRAFAARPPKVLIDRLQDLADDPALSAVWSRLTPTQRQTLRDRLVAFMGSARFRGDNEPVDLG
jgi:hypothetical protein